MHEQQADDGGCCADKHQICTACNNGTADGSMKSKYVHECVTTSNVSCYLMVSRQQYLFTYWC